MWNLRKQNKQGKKRQNKKHTLNHREQSDGYERGDEWG